MSRTYEEDERFLMTGTGTKRPMVVLPSPSSFSSSSRRNIVYGVLGLLVGSMIVGFLAHPTKRTTVATVTSLERHSIPMPVSHPDPSAPWPRVAWLMSFPNSGTSYTIGLVRAASLRYTATNYGRYNVDKELGVSIPVFDDSPNGPFWSGPFSIKTLKYPERGYVMTKTHCGARCISCEPSKYMETQHDFFMDCLSGQHIAMDEHEVTFKVKGHYDASLVHKAIHLIRNPFNNIVARFHLHIRSRPETYTNDKDGFRRFCMDENEKWAIAERESTLLEKAILDILEDVPCHAEFIRYVRWHNMAITTTKHLQVPTMILHYENYETKFNETLSELLDFLEQGLNGPPKEFIAGKDYMDYYTQKEIGQVHAGYKELAFVEVWQNIKHYFGEIA